jgi:hypothetical protein
MANALGINLAEVYGSVDAMQTAQLRRNALTQEMEDRQQDRRDREELKSARTTAWGGGDASQLAGLAPQEAMAIRGYFDSLDERKKAEEAAAAQEKANYYGQIFLYAANNPREWSNVRANLPDDMRAEAPEQYDQTWIGMQLARTEQMAELIETLGRQKQQEAVAGALSPSLIQSESGGNWQARNNVAGSGGVGHFGRGQFSRGRLQDARMAGVIPASVTPEMFMADPTMQQAVEQWHVGDIMQQAERAGVTNLIGQQVKGVPVTRAGIVNVAHLGGVQGMQRFFETGGQYDPADANGTRLSDYLALGAREEGAGGGGQPMQGQPAQEDPRAVAQRLLAAGVPNDTIRLVLDTLQPSGDTSAAEAQIARLMETGLDRPTAIGVRDGRYEVTQLGEVIDVATGQPVGAVGQQAPMMQAPEAAPAQNTSIMPTDVDYSTATGGSGFLSSIGNTLSDAVGAGLISPENERASQALRNLQLRLQTDLAGAVSGRPSNYLLERLDTLTVQPNSPFQGAGRSRERLAQTRDMVEEGIALNMEVVQAGVSPNARSEARTNIAKLRRLRDDLDTVLQSFGDRGAASEGRGREPVRSGRTGSGVQWSVE